MLNRQKRLGRLGGERGQSLVIALIVMFLLVFIGVIFVLVVARNQTRAIHSKDVLEAQYLAEAGINYADGMLRSSEQGADWRPTPTALGFAWNPAFTDPFGTHWEPAGTQAVIADFAQNHPDFQWLKPYCPRSVMLSEFFPNPPINYEVMGPDGGYTTYDMGKGRYLLRVSYNPTPGDATSKFIKIESVGRMGVVDKDDPTTWVKQHLRRELTAYKPIGVTDYARFEANKDHRRGEIALGAPGFPIKYGYYTSSNDYRPAPIRVNGNLTWYGDKVDVFLDQTTYGTAQSVPISLVEVSGDISDKTDNHVWVNSIVAGAAPAATQAQPSDGSFTTVNGLYRDGSGNVASGPNGTFARGIKRIEPPIIDSVDTPTRVPRYLTLTRDSGLWLTRTSDGRTFNSGRYGWGAGVYIDNSNDLQPESEALFGGYTPHGDWMKPNNNISAYWQGPYYVPPAVIITLNPYDTDGDGVADMTITRTDVRSRGGSSGRKPVWYDAMGQPIVGFNPITGNKVNGSSPGSTLTIPYPVGSQTFYYKDGTDADGSPHLVPISVSRSGVIYADGNIRIRGMLPGGNDAKGNSQAVQLTVVSGGIIYIDGNLLKYRDKDTGQVDQRCAISLLAKDYVCVNTTQFVTMLSSTGPALIGSDSGTGDPPYHLVITPEPSTVYSSVFSFGPTTGGTAVDPMLFCRQAGQYGPSYIDMWLNGNLLSLNPGVAGLSANLFGCGDPRFCPDGTGLAPVFLQKMWPLAGGTGIAGGNLYTAFGLPNYFEIGLDQSSFARSNYLLSAFTVQPLDIRIEAAMYAQNRSFYIIPGNWFNLNPNDALRSGEKASGKPRPRGVDAEWPFFGQALDVKITIDGAVTENLPAPLSDVNEWYSKWSNLPKEYGSSGKHTAHYDDTAGYGDGLTFLYDTKLGWPLDANNKAIRTDVYGRPLPVTPCLPVCESLVYYGEPT